MSYPDKEEIRRRYYIKKREKFFSRDFAICDLDHLVYPHHKTPYLTLSNVADPDVVVIYTYGGLVPHHFYETPDGKISDKTGHHRQFTYHWIDEWLSQNVAMVIFDMPDYLVANGHPWANSFYRKTEDRIRESKQLVDVIAEKYPNSKIVWAGISYGAQEAALISLEKTCLHKIANISGTWHTIPDMDQFHQGVRLDWYDVTQSTVPVLVVMHEKEAFEKAKLEMSKTDSILVTNPEVTMDEGHFFVNRETEVVSAICSWFRDNPALKIIL